MFPRKMRLCTVFGIPLYLDFSLIVLLFFFTMGGGGIMSGLAGAVLLLLSITAHELGHALTARGFGYETNDITLSLLGGCASLIALPRKASQEFLTALAGPLVSFALASLAFGSLVFFTTGSVWNEMLYSISSWLFAIPNLLFGANWHLGEPNLRYAQLGWMSPEGVHWIVDLLYMTGALNLMLGFFNLLPGFPLDGGRIFRSVMRLFMSRPRATFVAMVVGRVVAVFFVLKGASGAGLPGLFIVLGLGGAVFALTRFRGNLMDWLRRVRPSAGVMAGVNIVLIVVLFQLMKYLGSGSIMMFLIAWMIWKVGYREYQMALIEEGWGNWDYSARVSPPPYGGESSRSEIRKDRQ